MKRLTYIRYIAAAFMAVCALGLNAEVRWLATTHDFGAFDEDMGPVTCQFTFVNDGSEPIAVTAARASCGCTTPKYSREAVAPGDTGSIEVTYNPAGRPGRFEKSIAVDFSEPQPKLRLYIKGTVVGSAGSVAQRFPVECAGGLQLAKPVAMIGDVDKGKLRTVILQGYNRSTEALEPKVTGLPPYLSAETTPAVVPPGEQFSFIFYMRSDKCPLYGLVSDTVRVDAGHGESCPLTVTALVREDFSKLTDKQMRKSPIAHLASETLDFGRLEADVTTRTMTIKNLGKSPLELRRVYSADPGITVEASPTTVKPGKEAEIRVTVDRRQLRGALLNARVSVIANDPITPVQTLRVVGTF
ncbi:MAG: DUF1573 domain-containing protein [Bacteroidales bacterium]|nr:DUF1573 domain-containing protein [Bacteroidales bacterium]